MKRQRCHPLQSNFVQRIRSATRWKHVHWLPSVTFIIQFQGKEPNSWIAKHTCRKHWLCSGILAKVLSISFRARAHFSLLPFPRTTFERVNQFQFSPLNTSNGISHCALYAFKSQSMKWLRFVRIGNCKLNMRTQRMVCEQRVKNDKKKWKYEFHNSLQRWAAIKRAEINYFGSS